MDRVMDGARCCCCNMVGLFICPPPSSHAWFCFLFASNEIYSLHNLGTFEVSLTLTMLGIKKYYGLRGDSLSYAISFIAGLDFL